MVIGLKMEKLHRGRGGIRPPALPESENPGLFRVNCLFHSQSSLAGVKGMKNPKLTIILSYDVASRRYDVIFVKTSIAYFTT